MAERTFQFGEKKFSSILKVAGDWISWVTNQQTSLILPPPPPFFLSQYQAINLSSLSVCHKSSHEPYNSQLSSQKGGEKKK